MKPLLIVVSLLLVNGLAGQNVRMSRDTTKASSDSIGFMESVCFDSAVTDYKIDFTVRGQTIEQHWYTPCYTLDSNLKPGTVMNFSEIWYTGYDGKKRRLPPRKYIVK